MELKDLKVNIEKTKMMRNGKSGGEIVKTGRWPCAVCGKGVGAKKGIKEDYLITWPPVSPDLNPIGNYWSLLKSKLHVGGK